MPRQDILQGHRQNVPNRMALEGRGGGAGAVPEHQGARTLITGSVRAARGCVNSGGGHEPPRPGTPESRATSVGVLAASSVLPLIDRSWIYVLSGLAQSEIMFFLKNLLGRTTFCFLPKGLTVLV